MANLSLEDIQRYMDRGKTREAYLKSLNGTARFDPETLVIPEPTKPKRATYIGVGTRYKVPSSVVSGVRTIVGLEAANMNWLVHVDGVAPDCYIGADLLKLHHKAGLVEILDGGDPGVGTVWENPSRPVVVEVIDQARRFVRCLRTVPESFLQRGQSYDFDAVGFPGSAWRPSQWREPNTVSSVASLVIDSVPTHGEKTTITGTNLPGNFQQPIIKGIQITQKFSDDDPDKFAFKDTKALHDALDSITKAINGHTNATPRGPAGAPTIPPDPWADHSCGWAVCPHRQADDYAREQAVKAAEAQRQDRAWSEHQRQERGILVYMMEKYDSPKQILHREKVRERDAKIVLDEAREAGRYHFTNVSQRPIR